MSDYIPEENLVLIFKYLPVKTLLRFRCVCKEWKRLIDSPAFIQQHLSVQKPRFLVDPHRRKYLVVDPLPRPLVKTLSKPIENGFYVLVGTLHGVVCLCDYDNIVLWNPSLRKFSSHPFPSFFTWYFGDPRHTCYGFWIDPSTKEFKAIIIQRRPVVKCILYSSIRNGWGVIPTEKLVTWKSCKEGPPVMIGGVAHWGGCLDESRYDGDHYDHDHSDKVILSFDFVQECFDVIKMPDLYSFNSAPCRWQGTLSLLCWEEEDVSCNCEIYLRQEDSWVKMVHFEVFEPFAHAFWAMEDVEERKKKGKRKRDMEVRIGDLIGEPQVNVRILATLMTDSRTLTGELIFHGTKTGDKTLRKGLTDYDKVVMAYDFVESLLFP